MVYTKTQELIQLINWEETRTWLLFFFAIIGGIITIRSFSVNNEQRKIDNTFKVLDFLRRNISDKQIKAFIKLFQANNPLGNSIYEFNFKNGKKEQVIDMLSEGGCGNGDIHNMIELFELISPQLIKRQINDNLIWYEYGLIMNKCYDWVTIINEKKNPYFLETNRKITIGKVIIKLNYLFSTKKPILFPNFSKYMRRNMTRNLDLPCQHYTYVE